MNKASAPLLPNGSLYMEEVHVKVRAFSSFHLYQQSKSFFFVQLGEELWFTVGGQHIPFGASPQDIWTELGRPDGIHQKQVSILNNLQE